MAVDGERMSPAKLLAQLNEIGGEHGVGRVDLVENRYVGMKSRGVYETPGGTILHAAHRAVESITMDREVMHLRDSLIPRYAELVYNGYWFAPERELLQAADRRVAARPSTARRASSSTRDSCTVGRPQGAACRSTADFATFEKDEVYNQADAEGFIKLNALRLRIRALSKASRRRAAMAKTKAWAGASAARPTRIVEEFTASIPFDAPLYRYDIAGEHRARPDAGAAGSSPRPRRSRSSQGLHRDPAGDRAGEFRFDAARRGHPHGDRAAG